MFRVGPGWYRSIRRRGDAVAEHYNQFDRLFFRGSSPWIFTGQRPLARGL